MKANPRTDLGAHAPVQLPDVGELARINNINAWGDDPPVITRTNLELILWLAEHFWALHAEALHTEADRETALETAFDDGVEEGCDQNDKLQITIANLRAELAQLKGEPT